ncbi:hypothetical protein ABZU78_11805 [Rhodococcus erythropolis]|uniref:hypothetical protein n=1 Tax=Rhodococcus erythropolis TaxID=1833 RepID=UPI0033BA19BA
MSATTTVNTPHYISESILDVIGSTVAAATTAVNSNSALDITSTAQPIFDVVTSESVLDIVSSAQQSVVAVVASGSVLDFVPTSTQSPAGAVSSTSTLDILSEVTVFPGVPAVGASVLDYNSPAIQTPVAAVTSQSVLDIMSVGAITLPFLATGMTKNGNQTITATSISEITGWTPDSGSTVDSNALAPGGSKVSATVAFSMSVFNGGSGQVFSLYLYRNGVQVGSTVTKSVGFSSTDTLTGSQTLTVAPTDRFKLYVSRQFGIDHTVNAGANTYIRIT